MNRSRLRQSNMIIVALLAATSVTGCYSFKGARQDIADKEAELRRLQTDTNKESDRRKTLEKDPYAK